MTENKKKHGESLDDRNEKFAGPTFFKSPDPKTIPSPKKMEMKKDKMKSVQHKDLFSDDEWSLFSIKCL